MNQNDGRVKKIEAIWSDMHTKGDGKTIPIRRVVQIFDMEGKVIMEDDPLSFNLEQLKKAMVKIGGTDEQLGQLVTAMGMTV